MESVWTGRAGPGIIRAMSTTEEWRARILQLRAEDADPDPQETAEWLDALEELVEHQGEERGGYVLGRLLEAAQRYGLRVRGLVQTPYVNTIPAHEQPRYPGDTRIERRIRSILRWNAAAMVLRANQAEPGIGGHLATYASLATLYEVGFNHFFRGRDEGRAGDFIYFQGHSSPGIYARAFLEGRLTEEQLVHYRREAGGRGLSSYPHPWLMPKFWEFPTVSMGLGPISAIYHARFMRYLRDRGIRDTGDARVWCFVGDGECDEPETLGALWLASREKLDNLIFVINCNLQRLDGPVRGNGKIIQELESVFSGAGWNVLKVIWSSDWDPLLESDETGLLVRRMNEAVDGDYQRYSVEVGSYTRRHFFGRYPELLKLVEHLSDDQIRFLRRGGHDVLKVYAAYDRAVNRAEGRPTVILAKTVKGWTLGEGAEGRNVAHQQKKFTEEQLRKFRDLLELPIPDAKLKEAPFYRPDKKSEEIEYLTERRRRLGGFVPQRAARAPKEKIPPLETYARLLAGGKEEVSTTKAFVAMMATLLKDPHLGRRVVPIIADEARTFGIDALFRQVGIYSSVGQLYEPVDHHLLITYREAKDGQVIEEGITEAGATATWTAAGTAYANHGVNTIPFYIFYSMFGFQRTGDAIWAAADSRARGFLLGATAGRTTLHGEGLQHNDGHSPLLFSTVPTARVYDPCWAYELALIIHDGLQRMIQDQEDGFTYVTLYNENYPMPPMPPGVEEGVVRGVYRFAAAPGGAPAAHLAASGPILREALRAQAILAERFGVAADVWSLTSPLALRRDAIETDRWNALHPGAEPRESYLSRTLGRTRGPIVAVSDHLRAVSDQIAPWLGGRLTSLGTDGFGRSDTRPALRRHFEIDAEHVAYRTLVALARDGGFDASALPRAIGALGIDPDVRDPATA
jgi:pyruvate dehydrogenase E1 component